MISLSNGTILGDRDIIEYININPFDNRHINPASYDLTLSNVFLKLGIPKGRLIDPFDRDSYWYREIINDTYIVGPNEFILGSTIETIDLRDTKDNVPILGEVSGKSSLARLGLEIHLTAGYIDPGFVGAITLEIKNNTEYPILLTKNMRICQIKFSLVSHVDAMYHDKNGSKYLNDYTTAGSRYYRNAR